MTLTKNVLHNISLLSIMYLMELISEGIQCQHNKPTMSDKTLEISLGYYMLFTYTICNLLQPMGPECKSSFTEWLCRLVILHFPQRCQELFVCFMHHVFITFTYCLQNCTLRSYFLTLSFASIWTYQQPNVIEYPL